MNLVIQYHFLITFKNGTLHKPGLEATPGQVTTVNFVYRKLGYLAYNGRLIKSGADPGQLSLFSRQRTGIYQASTSSYPNKMEQSAQSGVPCYAKFCV